MIFVVIFVMKSLTVDISDKICGDICEDIYGGDICDMRFVMIFVVMCDLWCVIVLIFVVIFVLRCVIVLIFVLRCGLNFCSQHIHSHCCSRSPPSRTL